MGTQNRSHTRARAAKTAIMPPPPPKTATRRRRRRARTERPPQQVAAAGARETASSPNPAAGHLPLVESVWGPLPITPPPPPHYARCTVRRDCHYPQPKTFLIFVLKVHRHQAAEDDPTAIYALVFGWFFSRADRIIINRVRLNCMNRHVVFEDRPTHICAMGKRRTWAEKGNNRTALPITTPDEVCSYTTPLDITHAFMCFSL